MKPAARRSNLDWLARRHEIASPWNGPVRAGRPGVAMTISLISKNFALTTSGASVARTAAGYSNILMGTAPEQVSSEEEGCRKPG